MTNKTKSEVNIKSKHIRISTNTQDKLSEIQKYYRHETASHIFENEIFMIAVNELFGNLGFDTEPSEAVAYISRLKDNLL